MKQLVILSGKGGTGKTSLTAAFAHLAQDGPSPQKAVLADADVDAANLELVLQPQRHESHEFIGGSVATINQDRCQDCGICEQVCRFDAIQSMTHGMSIDPFACDGCAACVFQCPEEAIKMVPQVAGQWYRSESRFGPLYHAELFPAQENSGKLVTIVKQNARLNALDSNFPLVIVDGPPGIGCPVIAAAAGAHLALIVTEPSVAGIHDLERIYKTVSHFKIPALVIINKADINSEGTEQIEMICAQLGIEVIAHIPFDPSVIEAMIQGEPATCYKPDSPASQAMIASWKVTSARLDRIGEH